MSDNCIYCTKKTLIMVQESVATTYQKDYHMAFLLTLRVTLEVIQ